MSNSGKEWWATASPERRAQASKAMRLAIKRMLEMREYTSIELRMAALLDEQGIVYETQKKIHHFTVDFFIPSENLILEVYGCYWHGCQKCGYGNAEFKKRDIARNAWLKRRGYKIKIIWGHDLGERH